MSYMEITDLETKVDQLLRKIQHMNNEIALLSQQLTATEIENSELIQKNKAAIYKIKIIMDNLKEEIDEK